MVSSRAGLPAMSRTARARLLLACVVSFVVHIAILVGMPVNPTGGTPDIVSVITATLEPAAVVATVAPVSEIVPLAVSQPSPAPSLTAEAKPIKRAPAIAREVSNPVQQAPSPSTGVELPLIRDPTYYPAKQLDVYPEPLAAIRLDYPDTASNARIDGRLTVQLLIDEFGVVNEVSVVDAKPEGYFEEGTLAVFRSARFSPAQKQGHAVKSRVVLQVKYLYGESVGAQR